MDEKKLDEIRDLLEQVVFASTKDQAKPIVNKLNSIASSLAGSIDGYTLGKLRQAISHAKQASGRVPDKNHWHENMKQHLYIFESEVRGQLSKIDS